MTDNDYAWSCPLRIGPVFDPCWNRRFIPDEKDLVLPMIDIRDIPNNSQKDTIFREK
jgi:hypothetical protein